MPPSKRVGYRNAVEKAAIEGDSPVPETLTPPDQRYLSTTEHATLWEARGTIL
jgi:hypothetical protein